MHLFPRNIIIVAVKLHRAVGKWSFTNLRNFTLLYSLETFRKNASATIPAGILITFTGSPGAARNRVTYEIQTTVLLRATVNDRL